MPKDMARPQPGRSFFRDHELSVHQNEIDPFAVGKRFGERCCIPNFVRIEDHEIGGHGGGDTTTVFESQDIGRERGQLSYRLFQADDVLLG